MKRLAHLKPALVLVTIISMSAGAYLGPLDPDVRARQLAKAEELYSKRDVKGLLRLLKESHLFIKTDVALKLGRLRSRKALPLLREYDKQYSQFACAPSGQFGVATHEVQHQRPDGLGGADFLVVEVEMMKDGHRGFLRLKQRGAST